MILKVNGYDVGEKFGFIQTTIEFALQDEELRDSLLSLMEGLVNKSKKEEVVL